jgi:HAD superfamily hydrolase (TIGR01509 family)
MNKLKAVIFDVDGTIAETETYGHRVAFNRAFSSAGLNIELDIPTYGSYLKIGGGKERLRKLLSDKVIGLNNINIEDFIIYLHNLKTNIYNEIALSGELSLRPGVKRIIEEALSEGIKLAVASTSNEKSVNILLDSLLGAEVKNKFSVVLAGDIVKNKKPDPEIYSMSAAKLGIKPSECVSIEDSGIGVVSSKAAGIRCIVTVSDFSKEENFESADLVIDSLGEPDCKPVKIISNPHSLDFGYINIDTIKGLFNLS